MANTSALETLIELAQRDSDDAAKRLGAALRSVEEAEQKLQMLLGYRDDYANRLDQAQMNGITPFAYANFVAFVGKLDNAINGQQEVLKHAKYKSELEKTTWQESERKRLSYRTLTERAAAEALKTENKRDQKMMDDHAARTARRANH
ncbi:flagella biosynthesis chaperone FliJ [Massilia sp. Dwa41.01b]|uniref:flagellar export protein FliJ n=1 Tax=unclassified Massilia TaxID=2609279 RepID=UPI001600D91B|nr:MULTISPECIES: flagellar export protein FliJ [unclassified Massilia]QNA90073.1 flagella biosynthesis chaperone FliJ [Massilia sp. Dwa41.01b]QNB00962.1 flagella biosynthesis chaperone FliJ [Massilia sp. Se16.2.3]